MTSKLCDGIETLAMTYLDGELADGEQRELELHLLECEDCRGHVDGERQVLGEMRRMLTVGAAPAALRARIGGALDQADRDAVRARRRERLTGWILPGFATLAAAAALVFFVANQPTEDGREPLAAMAISQHMRRAPLEVQGAATTSWIQQHYRAEIEPPRFANPNIRVAGARLTDVMGRDALQLFHEVQSGSQRYAVKTLVFDARGIELPGQRVPFDGAELLVDEYRGYQLVALRTPSGLAYLFTSSDLPRDQLLDLVVNSTLASRVQQRAQPSLR